MQLTLAKKIVIPFALVGVVVMLVFGLLQGIEYKQRGLVERELVLAGVLSRVHEVSARVQSGILTRQESYAIEAAQSALAADAALTELTPDYPEAAALLAQFQDFFAGMVAINSMYLENRLAEGEKRLTELGSLEQNIDQAVSGAIADSHAARGKLAGVAITFKILSLLGLGVVLALVSAYVMRQVVKPIKEIAGVLDGIAQGQGDLTARIEEKGQDEIGDISRAFNSMMSGLREMVAALAGIAAQVANQAEALAASMSEVKQSSANQSAAAASMAAAVEELTVSVSHVAEMAGETRVKSSHSLQVSLEGVALAERSAASSVDISNSSHDIAKLVAELSKESERIQAIVGVIKEVADQTNLLALNAAIEAARAGEQGRGFAVVADEVRKLAENTNRQTMEIQVIVGNMANAVGGISKAIDINADKENEETRLANEVGRIFETVGGQSRAIDSQIADVAGAMREQSAAATDVAQGVERIAQMAERNDAAASGASDGAARLQALALELKERVARFNY
jgi:methyl-accepting chemotaxis protein